MKRIKIFFASYILFALCLVVFSACNKGGEVKATLVSSSETRVVIRVDERDGNATLGDAMDLLQRQGKWAYSANQGMISSINGIENAADFSACWMLYTSDSEMATTEWGVLEYNGELLGGAILGYGDLPVIENGIYVWEYVVFSSIE